MLDLIIETNDVIPRQMKAYTRRLEDFSPINEQLAQLIRFKIEESFESFKDPFGNAWKPIKPESLRRRKQTFTGILTDTGDLRDQTIVEVVGDTIVVSQPAPKSIHNFGHDGRGLPARPSVPVDGLPEEWAVDVSSTLLGALRKEFPWL